MKRIFLFILLLAPNIAFAGDNSDVTVQILPLNCVFETVNTGTNTIQFLTPAECGVIASPVIDQPPSSAYTAQGSSAVTLQPKYNPNSLQETAPTVIDNGVTITYSKPEAKPADVQEPKPSSDFPWLKIVGVLIIMLIILMIVGKLLGFGALHFIIKPIILLNSAFISLINRM